MRELNVPYAIRSATRPSAALTRSRTAAPAKTTHRGCGTGMSRRAGSIMVRGGADGREPLVVRLTLQRANALDGAMRSLISQRTALSRSSRYIIDLKAWIHLTLNRVRNTQDLAEASRYTFQHHDLCRTALSVSHA